MTTLEEPFYYLKNFHIFIDWIEDRYQHVLNPSELEFLENFRDLPESAQAILVRLIMRKGNLFRSSKIKYAEIEHGETALSQLAESGFLTFDSNLTVLQLSKLLLKQELAALFSLSHSMKKQDMVATLANTEWPEQSWLSWLPNSEELLIELTCRPVIQVFRLMFFGNLRQDLTEFVVSHLGVVKYETVAFSNSDKAFTDRKEIDDYLILHQCTELIEEGQWQDALVLLENIETDRVWMRYKQQRIRYLLAYHFERLQQYELALNLYGRCDSFDSRLREIRILMAEENYTLAWSRWQALYADNDDVGIRLTLNRIATRLAGKVGEKAPLKHQIIEEMTLNLPKPEIAQPIEITVKQYLETPEKPVFFVENSLFTALLGLWCWDAVFLPVKGAFFNPFQMGPADLTHPDFMAKREPTFNKLWSLFENDRYVQHIQSCYKQKSGLQNPLVNWTVISEITLNTALECISGLQLKAIFKYMLTDLKARRSGIPDLIRFDTRRKDFELIEVKGPGDRLQQNQSVWFEFYRRQNIAYKLSYIKWSVKCNSVVEVVNKVTK